MRYFHILLVMTLLCIADTAAALPRIVIFNYTPPLPTFELTSVKPDDHAQLAKAPESVRVTFNETVDEDGSDLTVFDPYNNIIAKRGKMTRDASMEASIPPNLLAGTYRVEWKATCACSGKTIINGTSYFTIY